MTLLNADLSPAAPEADAALQQALAAFDTPAVGGVASNVLKANAQAAEAEAQVELPETEEEVVEEAEEETTEEDENSAFAAEFEQEFGIKPTEAVALVQELQGFRQELSLMREWQVSPVEYDARLSQVKEFYGTLPEGERDKFNSPEGAKAIWNHLVKQGQAKETNAPNRTRRATRTVAKQTPAKQELLKKSDILAMDEATYMRELPNITRAYREGRVVE